MGGIGVINSFNKIVLITYLRIKIS